MIRQSRRKLDWISFWRVAALEGFLRQTLFLRECEYVNEILTLLSHVFYLIILFLTKPAAFSPIQSRLQPRDNLYLAHRLEKRHQHMLSFDIHFFTPKVVFFHPIFSS